jgi:hypothetical protein
MKTNISTKEREKVEGRREKLEAGSGRTPAKQQAASSTSTFSFLTSPFSLLPFSALCGFFFILLLALCFTACPVEVPEEDGLTVKLRIYGDDGTKYFSFGTGEEITGAGVQSQSWDIALEAHDGSFFVLTNSGASAERAGSGGNGAVWYTESTEFNKVTLDSRVTENLGVLETYTTDKKRYAMVMSTAAEEYLNVMTYLGYPDSDKPESNGETLETHFKRKEPDQSGMASYVPYLFNQKQFFSMKGMPPNYTPAYRVYIVRHGDGAGYSKLQITDVYLEYDSKTMANSVFVLKIRHEKL